MPKIQGKSIKVIKIRKTKQRMYQTEGYWNVEPKIKHLSFPKRGKFQVDLYDGRSIVMPVSAFPSLKRVPVQERNQWYLMGGGVTWDSCPEVIHIEQILGNYQNYAHEHVQARICPLQPKGYVVRSSLVQVVRGYPGRIPRLQDLIDTASGARHHDPYSTLKTIP